jgi:hypothetical protein
LFIAVKGQGAFQVQSLHHSTIGLL